MLGPDFKTHEVRGEKQADEGTPVIQSSPVSWRGTAEPATREFKTHATPQFIAGEDYSRPRHSAAIQCTNQQQHLQTYSCQLTSKLPAISCSIISTEQREEVDRSESIVASSTHFRPYVTTVESACHGIFSKASQEPANVDLESICIVRSAATSAVSQW